MKSDGRERRKNIRAERVKDDDILCRAEGVKDEDERGTEIWKVKREGLVNIKRKREG